MSSILSHSPIDHITFSELICSIYKGNFILKMCENGISWLILYSEDNHVKCCDFHINTAVPIFSLEY